MTSLAKLTDALLHAATRAGAETADAIAIKGHSVAVEVRDRALEHAESAESVEIGLRVLLGQRQATVASSDTGAEAIAEMAERAVDMARVAPEDAHVGLADPDQLARHWDLGALDLVDGSDPPAPAEMERTALLAEAAALSHQGISQV
ncbi:MAG: TldD/PmbA family protein, partial [Boseongicola sp.]|nr:TldD/PmbA family protein [Boseongicola sp.]